LQPEFFQELSSSISSSSSSGTYSQMKKERKKESCKKHIVPADVETLFIKCKECNKQISISQKQQPN
jgi:hypothetical protein